MGRGAIDIKVLKDLKTARTNLSSGAGRGTGPRPTVNLQDALPRGGEVSFEKSGSSGPLGPACL